MTSVGLHAWGVRRGRTSLLGRIWVRGERAPQVPPRPPCRCGGVSSSRAELFRVGMRGGGDRAAVPRPVAISRTAAPRTAARSAVESSRCVRCPAQRTSTRARLIRATLLAVSSLSRRGGGGMPSAQCRT